MNFCCTLPVHFNNSCNFSQTTSRSSTTENCCNIKVKKSALTLSTGRRSLRTEKVNEVEASRRAKRRENNRLAAARCREKKLSTVVALEDEITNQLSKQLQLKTDLKEIETKRHDLEELLKLHVCVLNTEMNQWPLVQSTSVQNYVTSMDNSKDFNESNNMLTLTKLSTRPTSLPFQKSVDAIENDYRKFNQLIGSGKSQCSPLGIQEQFSNVRNNFELDSNNADSNNLMTPVFPIKPSANWNDLMSISIGNTPISERCLPSLIDSGELFDHLITNSGNKRRTELDTSLPLVAHVNLEPRHSMSLTMFLSNDNDYCAEEYENNGCINCISNN